MHTVNMKYKSPGNIQVLIKNKKKKKEIFRKASSTRASSPEASYVI